MFQSPVLKLQGLKIIFTVLMKKNFFHLSGRRFIFYKGETILACGNVVSPGYFYHAANGVV